METIIRAIAAHRFTTSSEAELQDAIEGVLERECFAFDRGLRDPNAAIVESIATDAVKRLAESYLQQRGLSLPGKVA